MDKITRGSSDIRDTGMLDFEVGMYIDGSYVSKENSHYIGNKGSDSLGYNGALGHQYIFDIDNDNNTASNRNDFEYGMIIADPESNQFVNDDFGQYRDQVINNTNRYDPENGATDLEVLNYEPIGNINNIFTSQSWTGLSSHLILGKHEYDTAAKFTITSGVREFQFSRVASIDGYTTQIRDARYMIVDPNTDYELGPDTGNISHARGVAPSNPEYPNVYGVTEILQQEKGTDPLNMGLWFKPYLVDDNGGIEINPANYQDAYAQVDTGPDDDYYWYHHERYSVGTGTIQAGENGKGLVSIMPMFDWNGQGTNGLVGGAYGTCEGSDIRGMTTNRGTGGLSNSPTTRDYTRQMLSMTNGAMMVAMMIDNTGINMVKDNKTSSTNFLDPQFDNGELLDKYPYNQDTGNAIRSLRVNNVYGTDQLDTEGGGTPNDDSDDYASYPLFTGTYGKYVFANTETSDDWDNSLNLKFSPMVAGGQPGYDAWTPLIGKYVGTTDSLVTHVALDYGDINEESLGEGFQNHVQYLSLNNLHFDGDRTDRQLVSSVVLGTDFGEGSNMYGVTVGDSLNYKYNAGISASANEWPVGTDNFVTWDEYITSEYDPTKSNSVNLTQQILSGSGYSNVDGDENLTTEAILYNPVVGAQNIHEIYEFNYEYIPIDGGGYTSPNIALYNRGMYPMTTSSPYISNGATLPWSSDSAVIMTPDETIDNNITSYSDPRTTNLSLEDSYYGTYDYSLLSSIWQNNGGEDWDGYQIPYMPAGQSSYSTDDMRQFVLDNYSPDNNTYYYYLKDYEADHPEPNPEILAFVVHRIRYRADVPIPILATQKYEDGSNVPRIALLDTWMVYDHAISTDFKRTYFPAINVVDGLTNDQSDPEYGGWDSFNSGDTHQDVADANQWLAIQPDQAHGRVVLDLTLNQASRPVENYLTKAIQISPAMNMIMSDIWVGETQVYVDSVKDVLYNAYDDSGNLIDRRYLRFTEWQVSDYVIYYEESLPIAHIELMIMSVYDNDYSSTYLTPTVPHPAPWRDVGNAKTNFGGFSEVTWHLDPVSDPSELKVSTHSIYGEDSIRGRSPDSNVERRIIDAGEYLVTANDQKIGLSNVAGIVYTGTSKSDRTTNERYNVGMKVNVDGTNTYHNNAFAKNIIDENMKIEEANREKMRVLDFTMNAIFAVAAIIEIIMYVFLPPAGVTIGLGWKLLGMGIKVGAKSFLKKVLFMQIIKVSYLSLNVLDPTCELSGALSVMFDWIDGKVSLAIDMFSQLVDIPIAWLTQGRAEKSISILGPVLLGGYMLTLDIQGTIPRLHTYNHMNEFYPGVMDWRHIMFEKYEIALLSGQNYNWANYYTDVSQGTGRWPFSE